MQKLRIGVTIPTVTSPQARVADAMADRCTILRETGRSLTEPLHTLEANGLLFSVMPFLEGALADRLPEN